MGNHNKTIGDMLKSTYDPNEDGLIALAQLVVEVCSKAEADGKVTAHAGVPTAHHTLYSHPSAPPCRAATLLQTGHLPVGHMQKIAEASPSAAANVEFTGLSGDLFLLFYDLHPSGSTSLILRLNGVTGSTYGFREFVNGTSIASRTAQVNIYVNTGAAIRYMVGCLIIGGKQVTDVLTVGHFGGGESSTTKLLINGYLTSSGGNLSSILLYPLAGTFTGKAKLYKVA